MEFKRKLCRSKKAAGDRAKKELGFKKIKVRGRKRWVKPAEKAAK